jgi:protein involved in polysaccharide export with SLBB domain
MSIDRIEEHAHRDAIQVAADQAGFATRLTDGDIVRIDPIFSSYRDAVTLRGAVANPGRFPWRAGMRLSDLLPDPDSLVRRDYWWKRTRLGLPASPLAVTTGRGGLQTNTLPQNSNSASAAAIGTISSSAQIAPPEPMDNYTNRPSAIASPAAQTNWNQAVIERLDPITMSTTLIPFNLGKLVLRHDMSENFELKAGDVITIYAQQDVQPPIQEQTIYVELAGEFVHPGIYSVSIGEKLRSLVARAGGLTSRAYLYGSRFTRISTQVAEQEKLNEYADGIEHQIEHGGMGASNANNNAGPSGVSEQERMGSLNREMITRLRQVRASGRVVLKIEPRAVGLSMLPDMYLEDGDKLIVPFIPETIQVVGAVFNPHAFLYSNHVCVNEYLRLAGGPNREADRRHMYVSRADGSVVGQDMNKSVFESGIKDLPLYPGDALVVPEKEVHPSALNQLMLWSQLMSQASLNALEIGTLK